MRTIVLRVTQRANSRTIMLTASLEVDGHAIPNARMSAAAMNGPGGRFDQQTMGALVMAAKAAVNGLAKAALEEQLW